MTSRGKRKQERANKSRANGEKEATMECTGSKVVLAHKPPASVVSEMTEEEMIDLALRLSEQEASIVAIRRQKEEEEAMMKAIQDSVSTKWLTLSV